VWTVLDGRITRRGGEGEGEEGTTTLCAVEELPLSLAGRARHNAANALAAAAVARALGVADATIAAALREFGSAVEDNPGRASVWRVPAASGREARVLLDFAHNLAGIAAIAELVRGLPERLVALGFGMAGDRSDEELRELGAALLQLEPTWVILREQPD